MLFKSKIVIAIFIGVFLSASCKKQQKNSHQRVVTAKEKQDFNIPVKVKYAKGFKVVNHKNFKELYVVNLMQHDTLGSYIVALPNAVIPDSIVKKGTLITVPAKDIVCLSAPQVGALELLNLREKLVGANGINYLWDSKLREKIKKGKIVEIGEGASINTEKIAAIAPELLMLNSMDKAVAKNRFEKLGTHIIYNDEWKERNLLARAEWLKFIALFFCRNSKADSLFQNMETNYNRIKTLATKVKKRPSVLYGQDFKGSWYIPQKQSYVVAAFRDANVYFKASGKGSGSLPHSFEDVFATYHNADYWLTMYSTANTLTDLKNTNERYAAFNAFKNGNVYNNNKRRNTSGGNDYWESGIYHPDILLKDYIKIFHPDLLPDYELVYWQKLKR